MNEKYIHFSSVGLVVTGLVLIGFLYWTEPRTIAEVTTKGQVAIGTYAVNDTEFLIAMSDFRKEEYASARLHFERADPEKRDAKTQFMIAYSYYRQGWGRISNDDTLFAAGLESAKRSIATDPNFRSTESDLVMKTAFELQTELDSGIKLTLSDFDPTRLVRERK